MKTILSAVLVLAMSSGTAWADILLVINPTAPNQITITATSGLSAIDATADNGIGVYLDNAFGASSEFASSLVSGNLTTFSSPSSGSPSLFRFSSFDPGLNFYNYSMFGVTSFTEDFQAFSGSATWNISQNAYDALLAGAGAGNIYANVDNFLDVPGNGIIGTWALIPTPGTAGLLGLAALAAVRRRR